MIKSLCGELESLKFQHHAYEGCKGKCVRIRVLTEGTEGLNELMWIKGLAKMHGMVAYWRGDTVEIRPKSVSERGQSKRKKSSPTP
jgi:hypothetical protein